MWPKVVISPTPSDPVEVVVVDSGSSGVRVGGGPLRRFPLERFLGRGERSETALGESGMGLRNRFLRPSAAEADRRAALLVSFLRILLARATHSSGRERSAPHPVQETP